MIFTVFAIAENEKLEGRPMSVLVICPLKSITSDQIVQLESLPSVAELIFTVFAIAENEKLEGRPVSVLVICPLKSITSDQIVQLEGLPSVAEFTPESSKKIIKDPPIFIYCSAEQALPFSAERPT